MPRSTDWRGRSAIAEPVASLALLLDAAIGWPPSLYARIGHPVGLFARVIGGLEARWNDPARSDRRRRLAGVVTLAVVVAFAAAAGWAATAAAHALLGRYAWIAVAVLAWPALAQRSLDDHVRPVAAALAAGDWPLARRRVAAIVGRDTDRLDEAGIARAAIETLAESFCDGIVAPFFWLLVLGLPGVWAFKAINTADSLIGHREARWRAFGWAAARVDDGANWFPARIAAALLCVAGPGSPRGLAAQARRHASPNAGWPEAAMAHILSLRLAGPVRYDGIAHAKPWIGIGRADARAADVIRALQVYRRACLLLWLIAGGVAWAL